MVRTRSKADPSVDMRAVEEADQVSRAAIRNFVAPTLQPKATVVPAPAGAGKSYLVSIAVGSARDRQMRVAVAAPTNEQAFGLVRRIAELHCAHKRRETVTFVPANDVNLPLPIQALRGVHVKAAKDANHDGLIVGTLSKLGDAFSRGTLGAFDALLVDESYQADSAKYFAAAGLAPVHFLVGDSGQISPFSTMPNPNRWRGLPEDPLQTAIGVLCRNHPSTKIFKLPITRRLDSRAAAVAKAFYPDLPFRPAVLPGVREVRFRRIASVDRQLRAFDAAIDTAALNGWAYLKIPKAPALAADPKMVAAIVGFVERLFKRRPESRCELASFTEISRARLAIGVAHNDQKDVLRVALAERGLGDVIVETANKLQGLEFELLIAWHPLAGLCEPDAFHLDPGRLCVLLTRHRQACIVFGYVGDEELVEDQLPPSTPAYLGDDHDPLLDGWEVHQQVFRALEPFVVKL